MTKRLTLDVWSDIACPWCYVGKRRLEAALARFPQRDEVAVRWHAFELDTSAPRVRPQTGSHAEDLARKYGMSLAQAEAAIQRLVTVARGEGLDFRFDRLRPGNTFDAHRVAALALARGGDALQVALTERFMRAYLTEGEALGEQATLARLAAEVGMDAAEVEQALASGAYADEVRADEKRASQIGINGVPCFVLDRRYGITGAQPADYILKGIEQAYAELSPEPALDGAACGPEGC